MLQRIPFRDPESSRPGVRLHQAEFDAFGTDRVPFQGGIFTVAPGATSRPDNHDVSECWMVARGSGQLSYDDHEYRISAGDYVLFEPRTTHLVHNDTQDELVVYTVWWLE